MPPRAVRIVLSISILSCVFPSAGTAAPPAFAGHAGLIAPKADPVTDFTLAFYGLTYPPLTILQAAIPIHGPFSTLLSGGYTSLGGGTDGGVASALVRGDLRSPTKDSWGAALVAYWMGGGAITDGEGFGATLYGGALVGSSPLGTYRMHLTAAWHTLPGDRDDGGAPSFILALERSKETYGLFVETVYTAPGAPEDSAENLFVLGGAELYWDKVTIKFGTGFIRFIGEEETYPAPPILAVIFPL